MMRRVSFSEKGVKMVAVIISDVRSSSSFDE